ncbi:dephospho-CoA kinase [Legionella drancourtii]|uniref:Dephospho-CoA kinase n=1 Tax=Legionella drancourtii LLAP12 TaxID=658187 RepID=G9EUQ9_9GAMM|nr:dephospho-CoA kinase [Legionella drancourtii]EHL29059.1 dephospho-CoA kinase [Legionella drancourtii LLAP12]
MVYCVGLTGGIASGKSTVAELFSELGIQVIYADKISKALTAKDQEAYMQIVTHYGTEILTDDGTLNRRKLRSIIFSDAKERFWLEQLLHPLIRQKIKEQVDSSITPYCIVEIPLLIDKEKYPYINRILLVNAPIETQIARVIQRDQCTREQALAILAAQPGLNLRLKEADDVLMNNLGFNELKIAVNDLHHNYLQKALMSGFSRVN